MCLLSLSLFAQGSDELAKSGSFYSRVGVGFPVDVGSTKGTGLLGVSYIDPFVPGLSNPAQWGSTVFGMATGGIRLQSFRASDNQSTSTNVLFNAEYFQLQLPLVRGKLGTSVSLRPYTRTTFQDITVDTRMIDFPGTIPETVRVGSQNNGGGGINKLEAGVGWKINANVSIGYAASFVFASIDNELTVVFDSPDFQPVNFTRQTSGVGFGNRIGAYFAFPNIFKKNDAISIGAVVSLPINLSAEQIERSQKAVGNNQTETVVVRDGNNLGDGTIKLPVEFSAGITYQVNRLLSVSTEGQYEQWSDYSSDFDTNEQRLVDRYKGGVGLHYNPYITNSNKFLSQFKYKLGATYDNGHINFNGKRIETLMFSLGLGIFSPQRNSNSSIDIGFEYGFRGTTSQNLVKENIWGISLSLNLAEIFFNRPKLR